MALATPPEEASRQSPLNKDLKLTLPKFFTIGKVSFSDLNFRAQINKESSSLMEATAQLIHSLNQQGYWPTPLYYTTNPYIGEPSKTLADNQYANTMVGDKWDTSPYPTENPVMGISTATYIKNMGILIEYLQISELEKN